VRAWLELARVALAPTIVWDVLAGIVLAGARPDARALPAIGVVLLIYHAGMVLNDWADRHADAQDRPGRPLPSGRIAAPSALLAGLGALAAAAGLAAWQLPPAAFQVSIGLIAAVLVYDLGGRALRRPAGPVLLALTRAGSLGMGALTLAGTHATLAPEGLRWGAAAYSLYFLFVARFATNEEHGTTGLRGVQFMIAAALAPLPLSQYPGLSPWIAPGWLALALWLLPPVLRDRYGEWSPSRVQTCVRRALIAAPLVPGIALLGAGQPLWALGAPAAALLVHALARAFRPE